MTYANDCAAFSVGESIASVGKCDTGSPTESPSTGTPTVEPTKAVSCVFFGWFVCICIWENL